MRWTEASVVGAISGAAGNVAPAIIAICARRKNASAASKWAMVQRETVEPNICAVSFAGPKLTREHIRDIYFYRSASSDRSVARYPCGYRAVATQVKIVCTADSPGSSDLRTIASNWNQRS